MLDVLQFIFGSFWRFVGTVVLLFMLTNGIRSTVIYAVRAIRGK